MIESSVVVGGGSGIGAAVAASQRALGSEVVTWDITGTGDLECDITDPGQISAAVEETLQRIGLPTMVTISAGVGHSSYLADADPMEWDRTMSINAKGPWLTMRALAPLMAGGDGGSIVAVGSVSSQIADKTMGLYCASKAALDMVVKVAALEWAPDIRVNAVAPGVTDTPMLGRAPRTGKWLSSVVDRTALGRLGTANDIAEAVLAVHSSTWMTGQIVVCDGGLSLLSPIDPTGQFR
jgi:NAD(P)-dependent dehydrogenase (short-subunit alcohol dehydrogenase family)